MNEHEGTWKSRKFLAAMGWQGIFTLLLWFDKLPADVYADCTFICLGGYFAANVAYKGFTRIGSQGS